MIIIKFWLECAKWIKREREDVLTPQFMQIRVTLYPVVLELATDVS